MLQCRWTPSYNAELRPVYGSNCQKKQASDLSRQHIQLRVRLFQCFSSTFGKYWFICSQNCQMCFAHENWLPPAVIPEMRTCNVNIVTLGLCDLFWYVPIYFTLWFTLDFYMDNARHPLSRYQWTTPLQWGKIPRLL